MAKDKIDTIENKIEAKVRDAKGHVKDAAGGLTGDIGLQAEGKFDQFAGHVQEDFADLYEEGESAVEKAVTFVRDKPLFSLGIVSVVGILLGWLFFPRRNRS
ncbi:MAG: CsbD family protein [Acetobacter syzygii]|uniref:CsbD family protein n=1 Tax=Acetobacter syzygii TaxID=146476 RepID=UPI0039E8456F